MSSPFMSPTSSVPDRDSLTPLVRKSNLPRPVSDSKKDSKSISPSKKLASPTRFSDPKTSLTPQHLLKTLSRLASPDSIQPPPAPKFTSDASSAVSFKGSDATPRAKDSLHIQSDDRKSVGGLIGTTPVDTSLLENEDPPQDLNEPSSFINTSAISHISKTSDHFLADEDDMTHTENVSFHINESAISRVLDASGCDLSPDLDVDASMGDEMYLMLRKLIKEVKDKVKDAETLYERSRPFASEEAETNAQFRDKDEFERKKAETLELIHSQKNELKTLEQSLQKAKEEERLLGHAIKTMEDKLSLTRRELELQNQQRQLSSQVGHGQVKSSGVFLPVIMIVLIALGLAELVGFYLYINYKREYASGRDPSSEIEGGVPESAWIVRVFDRLFSLFDILSGSSTGTYSSQDYSGAPF